MRADATVMRLMRWSLWLLLLPAIVASCVALVAGLTIGSQLWRIERPWVTVLWLLVLVLPVWIGLTLQFAGRSAWALPACWAAAWLVVAAYALSQLV